MYDGAQSDAGRVRVLQVRGLKPSINLSHRYFLNGSPSEHCNTFLPSLSIIRTTFLPIIYRGSPRRCTGPYHTNKKKRYFKNVSRMKHHHPAHPDLHTFGKHSPIESLWANRTISVISGRRAKVPSEDNHHMMRCSSRRTCPSLL